MVLAQYLSTTVYRYYIKQLVTKAAAVFTRRSAIILTVDFRTPRTLSNDDFRNPRTLTKDDFRNPRTLTSVDFEMITEV